MKYYLEREITARYFCHPSKRPFREAVWTNDLDERLESSLHIMRLYYKESKRGSEPGLKIRKIDDISNTEKR